jgi:uncharacterized protein YcfJ
MFMQFKSVSVVVLAALALCAAGCETKAQTGALVGTGVGAGLGAIIGNQAGGHARTGALIGAGVGAAGGYIAGNEMDKADERRAREYQQSTRSNRESRYDNPQNSITTNDVIRWTDQGVKDEVIIDRIERSGQVMPLSVADENRLRDAQVSEEVIRAIKNTSRR